MPLVREEYDANGKTGRLWSVGEAGGKAERKPPLIVISSNDCQSQRRERERGNNVSPRARPRSSLSRSYDTSCNLYTCNNVIILHTYTYHTLLVVFGKRSRARNAAFRPRSVADDMLEARKRDGRAIIKIDAAKHTAAGFYHLTGRRRQRHVDLESSLRSFRRSE